MTDGSTGPLTSQQVAILDLLSRGRTREVTARQLGLSVNTTKEQLRRLYVQLDVRCVAHAVRVALERGILQLDPVVDVTEVLPAFTHSTRACRPNPCCVHAPSAHALSDWPRRWHADRRLMERRCPHGVGHPDPDHLAYVRRTRGYAAATVDEVHGCDGCCRAPSDVRDDAG